MAYLVDGVKISDAEFERKHERLKWLSKREITPKRDLNTITKEELLKLVLELPDNSKIVFGDVKTNSKITEINCATNVKIKYSKFHEDWFVQDFYSDDEDNEDVIILFA